MEVVEINFGSGDTVPRSRAFFLCVIIVLAVSIVFSSLVAALPDDSQTSEPDENYPLDSGDVAWMIVASCLVMLMTPGLGFFYGGMVEKQHTISTLMQSFICIGLITALWTVFTFSLVFGDDRSGVIGTPRTHLFFEDVGAAPNPRFSKTVPFTQFSIFQLYFAVITPAIISGSFSERIKFVSYVTFVCIWHVMVYCPIAHIAWHPDGLLRQWGVLDFAGGSVVHMTAGFSALVGSMCLEPKKKVSEQKIPANIPFVILGTALLWFGWIGFNAGSALGANELAVQAFLVTNASAATALCTWVTLDILEGRKISAISACNGAVVGLVIITPSSGYVTVGAALCIGVMGSIACHMGANHFKRLDFDDALDVFPCHGIGGAFGMLLTGCFANHKINASARDGLFYGGTVLIGRQIAAIICVALYIVGMSYLIFKAIDRIIGLPYIPNPITEPPQPYAVSIMPNLMKNEVRTSSTSTKKPSLAPPPLVPALPTVPQLVDDEVPLQPPSQENHRTPTRLTEVDLGAVDTLPE